MPGPRQRYLQQSPCFHVRRFLVSSPKCPVLVFDKEDGIVFPALELMHRHNANARDFAMAVRQLVLKDRIVQRGFSAGVGSILLPQLRQLILDCRATPQQSEIPRMISCAFQFIRVSPLQGSADQEPVFGRGTGKSVGVDRIKCNRQRGDAFRAWRLSVTAFRCPAQQAIGCLDRRLLSRGPENGADPFQCTGQPFTSRVVPAKPADRRSPAMQG